MSLPLDMVVDQATADQMRTTKAGAQLKGSSGMTLWAGKPVGWEPNKRLADSDWFGEVLPKVQVNPVVDTAARARLDLIQTAKVKVGGRKPNPEAADFLRRQWGLEGSRPRLVRDTFASTLRRAAQATFTGLALFEWDTRIVEERGRRFAYLNKLHDRHPASIHAFLTDESEQLVGVLQRVYGPRGGARLEPIPVSQLLVLSYRMRGATDFNGFGLWRSIVREAQDFTENSQAMLIGSRKFAVGEFELEVDVALARESGAIPDGDVEKFLKLQRGQFNQWLKARSGSEASGLVKPNYWKVGLIAGTQGYDPGKMAALRNHYAEHILRGHVAQFLLVASSQGSGGFNAAAAHQEALGTSCQNDAEWVLEEMDQQVNGPLLAMNFKDLDPDEYPRLEVSGLRAPVYITLAPVIAQLTNNGSLRFTARDEDKLRADVEMLPFDPSSPVQSHTVGETIAAPTEPAAPAAEPAADPAPVPLEEPAAA